MSATAHVVAVPPDCDAFPLIQQASGLPFDAGSNFSPLCQLLETGRISRVPPKLDFSYLIGWAAGLGSVAPADTI
jgi:hypothetical protein